MKLRRRWKFLIAAMAFALLLVGVCIVASRDEPPPDDSDLVSERSVVAVSENGLRFFEGAGETQDVTVNGEDGKEEKYPGEPFGEDWDPDVARQFVDLNRDLLERFDKSFTASRFQVPRENAPPVRLDYLRAVRDASWTGRIRAALLFQSGDETAALEETLKVVRFGRRLQEAEGGIMDWLVSIAIESSGLKLLRTMVQRAKLSDQEILPRLAELDRWVSWDDSLVAAYKREYQETSMAINLTKALELMAELEIPKLAEWRLWRSVVFKPNQTCRFLAESFRALLDWNAPWRTPPGPLGFRNPIPELDAVPWMPTNCVGKALCTNLLPTLAAYLVELGKVRAENAAPAILFALRRYHRDKGQLPAALKDLVPQYIDRVPIDPFDAKPLKYSRDEKLVYAVGPSGRNQDGSSEDLTWKIER